MRFGLFLSALAVALTGASPSDPVKAPAKTETAAAVDNRDRSRFYAPPQKPNIPKVRDQGWLSNAVDAFILEKLEAKGLAPSPRADKLALLRRVAFDLTGLPPTLADQDAFLADNSPAAYARVVDRLLAS